MIDGSRCHRTRRSVSAAIDQEAAAGELRSAVQHLSRCADCRRFFAEIDAISSLAPSDGARSAKARRSDAGQRPAGIP